MTMGDNALTLHCAASGLSSRYGGRIMEARRRNRVSKPDPSKEGPVSKGTGLLFSDRRPQLHTRLEIPTACAAVVLP
jgi:hypothetical protein